MKSAPWQVRGVAPAAQETAQEAARRSGQSVGEWLNALICGSADKPAQHAGERASPRRRRDIAAVNDRLERLARRVDRLAQAKPTESGGLRDDELPRRLADAIARLDRRLDQLIQEARHAKGSMKGDMGRPGVSVDRALAALGEARLQTAMVSGAENVEHAVAEIAARQRMLDADVVNAYAPPPRFRPVAPQIHETDLAGLEQQLKHITAQIETLQRPCSADGALAALRQDLAEIARTLSNAMPRNALEALEGELRKLAGQVEAGRRSGNDQVSIDNLERGLAEVRDALRNLTPAESLVGFGDAVTGLSRKIDMLSGGGPDPAALQQLESSIMGLRDIVSHVASSAAVEALAAEVRALGERVERGLSAAGSDLLSALEKRIATIADAIETARQEGQRAASPPFDTLMQALSDKLENIQLARSDQLAFGNLEERITRLVEKLDASEAKLGHLASVERGMAELLVHLEQLRSGQNSRTATTPGAPAAAGVGFDALTRDVAEVRHTQSMIGRRTEDSLEAVQGTIGDVVNRLAMIESDLRSDGKSAPPSPRDVSTGPVPPSDARPLAAPEAGPLSAAPAAQPRPQAASSPRAPINPGLPPDYPLEPGSGMPRAMVSPADRIAASELPLRAARAAVAVTPEPDEPSDYLQAARRAAMAASQQGSKPGGDAAGLGGASRTLGHRLKQLFAGVGIVLAVAASFRFAGIYLDPDRVILADVPPPAVGDAPLLPPSSAHTITIPDHLQFAQAPARAEPKIEYKVEPKVEPRIETKVESPPPMESRSEPPSIGMPPSGTLAFARAPAPPAAAPRNDITSSVPAKAAAPVNPVEPAPVPPTPAAPEHTGLGAGLMAAASAGDPAAAYEVATRYVEGRGVPQSYKEAAVWFERAANRGLAPAQFRLGTLHEKGLGVAKDLQEARRLYLAAAEKGNPKAMHNMAVLYAEGIDGKPDYVTAVNWFRKAAAYGVADSQYNLAILYARGIGVAQNLSESFKWFAVAANRGDQEAVKKRDEIASRLDKQALAAARLAAQNWTAALAPEEATTVKPPAGGWEQAAAPAVRTEKPKPRQRTRAAAVH